ncbi:uncharacterized protein LOC128285642 [Gossypium arboreum]|uniref:uncharacterized protein LOC128285642 n=1 Tax=Gossypium arboreum TaxID=29729 RepID=UPI0022F19BD7|nr:uncharacterized protein LOC128285642 [Gossypium arboreum]
MITRSKLVDQLRGYQIRSQNKTDVGVATFWAIALIMLMLLSFLSLYFRHYWLSIMAIWLGILLPIRLRSCRQALVKKSKRKFLLPLSM